MTRLEVRDGQKPKIIYGWLNVPDVDSWHYTFLFDGIVTFSPTGQPCDRITLLVARLFSDVDTHPVLLAENVPIQILRRIVGFEENHSGPTTEAKPNEKLR